MKLSANRKSKNNKKRNKLIQAKKKNMNSIFITSEFFNIKKRKGQNKNFQLSFLDNMKDEESDHDSAVIKHEFNKNEKRKRQDH